jgi:hypothetical protein
LAAQWLKEGAQMMHDLPDDERDDEFMDENFEPGAPEKTAASEPRGTSELPDVEPTPASGASDINELPLERVVEPLAKSADDREFQPPLPPQAPSALAAVAPQALEKEIAELRARAAQGVPAAGEPPAIADAFERRENMGRGGVEIGVHRRGDPVHAVKLGDAQAAQEQSSDFGAIAPPTPTLPVGAGREELFRAPHVMLIVQLADARSVYDDRIVVAGRQLADDYRAIAEAEVKLGFWRHENQRRAADFRLRGPSW